MSAGYLPREIPGNSVKRDGGNENYHRKNCCESDLNPVMVRLFAEQIHIYSHGHKRMHPTPARVVGRFRLISPPPKTAQSQASLLRCRAKWLRRATGRVQLTFALREESSLNLSEFHGRGEFLVTPGLRN